MLNHEKLVELQRELAETPVLSVYIDGRQHDPAGRNKWRTQLEHGLDEERRKLAREFRTVRTRFGDVTVKLGLLNGQVVQAAPEYESCRRVADASRVPLKQVYEEARINLAL